MKKEELRELLSKNINELPLSYKAINGLIRNNIRSLKDLIKLTSEEVSNLYCVSKQHINEIKNYVHDDGLLFKDEAEIIQIYAPMFEEELKNPSNALVYEQLKLLEEIQYEENKKQKK